MAVASGIELASAYIQLIPSLRGAQREIQRQMGPIGDRTGQQFGQDFNDAATSEMEGRNGIGGVAQNAAGFGADFGKKFGAAAALAIGAAVGASVVSAINQEVEIDRVSAALGASPREAERLGALAGKLYGDNFGDSVGGVATALESVRSSFRSLGTGPELRRVTEQALNFTDIFQIDLPRAVSVAQTVVRAGLARDATGALDLLTAAAQRVPAALRENILDAADEYGQFFRAVGFGGEQTFTALVDNARLGEFGIDKAGDAIKEFTILSTDLSTNSVAAYDTLGLSAEKSANAILQGGVGASKATQAIIDGLLGIKDPATQANTAIALFGTPLEDLGVKNIPTFLKSLQNGREGLGEFRGALDRAGETANDNASRNIESFKRQVTQTFVNLIGKRVLPFITNFAAAMSQNLAPVVQRVRDALAKATPFLERVGDFLRDNQEYVRAFGIGLGIVATAMAATAAATALFSLALQATGIPLLVIGLAAAAAGLYLAYKRSEQFRDVVARIGQSVGRLAETLVPQVRALGESFVKNVLPAVRQFGEFVRQNVLPVLADLGIFFADKVVPAIQRVATFILTVALPAIGRLISDVSTKLKPVFDQLVQTFITRVLPTLIKVFGIIRSSLPAIGQIIGFVARFSAALIRLAATVLGKLLPPLIRLVALILSKVIPLIAALISTAIRLAGNIASVGSAVLNVVGNFREFASGVADAVDRVVRNVTDGIGGIPDQIIGFVGAMVTAGAEFIGGLFDGMRDAASGVGGLIGDIASAVGSAIVGAINGLIQQLNDAIPDKIKLKGAPDINIKDNPFPTIPGYAGGTNFAAGGLSLVGERGPELVTLPRGSRVDTAAATRRMIGAPSGLAATGGTTILRVGDREFIGYMEQIADARLEVADDMNDERSRAQWSR